MKNAVIGVLATLVVLMGGYLVYDKVIDNDSKEKSDIVEKKDDKVAEKDFDLVEAKELVDKYLYGTFSWLENSNDFLKSSIDMEKYKLYSAIVHSQSTKINYTCEEAFPEYKDQEVDGLYIVKGDDFWGACYKNMLDSYNEYIYDDVNESYKALFGKDGSAPKINVSASNDRLAYSEKYNAYIRLSCECGGIRDDISDDIYGVKSAKLIGDKLIINIGYSTYYGTEKEFTLNTANGEVKISGNINETEILDKYLDKFDTYEFEFFKEDGTYKLKNVTKK